MSHPTRVAFAERHDRNRQDDLRRHADGLILLALDTATVAT